MPTLGQVPAFWRKISGSLILPTLSDQPYLFPYQTSWYGMALRRGASRGHRAELGVCAAVRCSPAFPWVSSCANALLHPLCHCGMSDSHGAGVGDGSCSSRVSHTRPAFPDSPGGLSATPGPQSSLLMLCSASGGAGLLLPALN